MKEKEKMSGFGRQGNAASYKLNPNASSRASTRAAMSASGVEV